MSQAESTHDSKKTATVAPADFISRFGTAWQWLIGALAAAGAFAVANLALDKLGRGPTDGIGMFVLRGGVGWALIGVLLFIVGIVTIAGTVIWMLNASRVTWAYLQKDKSIPSKLRAIIEAHPPYYLGESFQTLSQLDVAYRAELMKGTTRKAAAFRNRVKEILDIAAIERTRILSSRALLAALLGAIMIGIGSWLFLVGVNSGEVKRADQVQASKEAREDELRLFPTGTLVPRTPSEISMLIPSATPMDEAQAWIDALGETCLLGAEAVPTTGEVAEVTYRGIAAAIVDIGVSPPGQLFGGLTRKQAVYQVVTLRSAECPSVVVGWVPPKWVVAPIKPAAPAPSAASASGTPTGGEPSGAG